MRISGLFFVSFLSIALFSCDKKQEHSHVPGEQYKGKEVLADCTHDGSYDLVTKCASCNEIIKTEHYIVKALGHNLTHYDGKPATCLEDGYLPYEICSRCNYSTYQTIPSTGHIHTLIREENRVVATCLYDGSYDLVTYCEDDDVELSREHVVVPALGHDLVHHDGKAASCTEIGYLPYDSCSRCSYSTYEPINPFGHELNEDFHCIRCDYYLEKIQSYDVSEGHDESIIADIYRDDVHNSYKLRISGVGRMQDATSPYQTYINDVDQIIVQEGITYIGRSAFYAEDYFYGKRMRITLPTTLTEIGNMAFMRRNIESINIPANLTTIRDSAFIESYIYCDLDLSNVTSIGDSAFYGATVNSLIFSDEISGLAGLFGYYEAHYLSIGNITKYNGCYYLPSKTNQYCLLLRADAEDDNITIHSRTRIIHNRAFYDISGIANIVIPDTVIEIGIECFLVCSDLESVTLSSQISRIEEYSFYGCSKMKRFFIKSHLSYIDKFPFACCYSLELIEYPGTNSEWLAIPKHEYAFIIGFSSSPIEYLDVTVRCSDGDIIQRFYRGNFS